MVRGEGRIGTGVDQQMRDATVVWPYPMDEQQNELIDRKTEQEGKSGRDENVPVVRPIRSSPPLGGDGDHEQRHTDGRHPDHRKIGERTCSCETVDGAGCGSVEII
jgi:hypothetical protein